MKNYTEKRSTQVAFFISLLIHFQLIFLFFYNKTFKEEMLNKQKNLDPSYKDWGSTQQRALSSGAPMSAPIFFKNEPEIQPIITSPLNMLTTQNTTPIPNETSVENKITEQVHDKPSPVQVPPSQATPSQAIPLKKNRSQRSLLSSTHKNRISNSLLSYQKKSTPPASSDKKKLTLAQLTQGFLHNNSQKQGSHAITMKGKKNTPPTDEQLKYERYIERIYLCLQNCYNINREKCPYSNEKTLTAKIFLALNRDGTIYNLALASSCGDNRIDRFFLFIFRDASSSFPPVPTYLPQNPFNLIIPVSIIENHFNTYQFS